MLRLKTTRPPASPSVATAPAAAPAESAPEGPPTVESLGQKLREVLPTRRLHSVSLCDNEANVLWLSEGALGPDEHMLVFDALGVLGEDATLPCHEVGLEDGRLALFLPVRGPRSELVGIAMIIADGKAIGDDTLERMAAAPVRAIMLKLAVLLKPAQAPGAAEGQPAEIALAENEEVLALLDGEGVESGAEPQAQAAVSDEPISPHEVSDILEFELTADETGAFDIPVVQPAEDQAGSAAHGPAAEMSMIEFVPALPEEPAAAAAPPPARAKTVPAPAATRAPGRSAVAAAAAPAVRPAPAAATPAAAAPVAAPAAAGPRVTPARIVPPPTPRPAAAAATPAARPAAVARAPVQAAAPAPGPVHTAPARPAAAAPAAAPSAPARPAARVAAPAGAAARATPPTAEAEAQGRLTAAANEARQLLELLPYAKLRAGGQTRRYQVLARAGAPARDPAAQDTFVLQRLISWLAANRSAWGAQPTQFTVNLSIAAVEDERFPQKIAAALNSQGIAPSTIGFEITEALCTQRRAQVERFIAQCDKAGSWVAIDEFSFDAQVLPLLRSKAVRLLKIDARLSSSALKDKLSQALVVATVQAAKVLGIHCGAKKVDSQAALQWLKAIGCDLAQGAALSPAQPLDALAASPDVTGLNAVLR